MPCNRFPDESDGLVGEVTPALLKNKKLDNSNTITIKDQNLILQNALNTAIQALFNLANLSAGVNSIDLSLIAPSIPVDVTTSRLLDTTYTNNSKTRTLQIKVYVRCVNGAGIGISRIFVVADTSTPPTTLVSGFVGLNPALPNESNNFQIVADIAPGLNYRVNSFLFLNGSIFLDEWFETFI
jgi:hypothetical protein